MKKLLIFLGIFFSFFLVSNKVIASENNTFIYINEKNQYDVNYNILKQIYLNNNIDFSTNYLIGINADESMVVLIFFNEASEINTETFGSDDYGEVEFYNVKWSEWLYVNDIFNLNADYFKNLQSNDKVYYNVSKLCLSNHNFLGKINGKTSILKPANSLSIFNINFHLNGGIAIDTYQSDIELQNIKNEMINSWTLYDTYKDKKSIMNDFNNLFLSPNLNDFTKFSNRYVTISNVSKLKQIYMKVINKEYAQPITYYEDFTINIFGDELEERLKKITITKNNMQFIGLYYDSNFKNNVKDNYSISSDVNLYAKWNYENANAFLEDNKFKSYTFDENYAYAFISVGQNVGQDVYLGLDFLNYSIEIYKYDKTNLTVNKGASLCLTPYFSKDNKYYYKLETIKNDYYNVLVLPREKLITEENGIFTTHYNFLLSENATVTYTNDLKNATIKDDSGNDITIDIEESYNYSQNAFLNDTEDLLTIFKNLLQNKDNNVFKYFDQIWQFLKRSKIFIYFNILIVGALIILVIKAANRR